MTVKLLIVEPDEELLNGYLSYFDRATEFKLDSATNARECLGKVSSFAPDVVMIEPESIGNEAESVFESVNVPVVVLSRFSNNEKLRSHPNVVEYFVKPAPLGDVASRIKQLF